MDAFRGFLIACGRQMIHGACEPGNQSVFVGCVSNETCIIKRDERQRKAGKKSGQKHFLPGPIFHFPCSTHKRGKWLIFNDFLLATTLPSTLSFFFVLSFAVSSPLVLKRTRKFAIFFDFSLPSLVSNAGKLWPYAPNVRTPLSSPFSTRSQFA